MHHALHTTCRALAAGLLALLLGGLALFTPPGLAQAEAQRVPGTRVWLQQPAGFSPGRQFLGWQHEAAQASVMVTEMPAPVEALLAGFSAEGLATRGMQLQQRQDLQHEGRRAALVQLSQQVGPARFAKWLLITGQGDKSLLVTATQPEPADPALNAQLKAVVLSTRWQPEERLGNFEGLPFSLAEQAGDLKLLQRVGNAVLYGRETRPGQSDPQGPVLVAAVTPVQLVQQLGLAAFAHRALREPGSRLSSIQVLREGPVQHPACDEAYEMEASANEASRPNTVNVYQLVCRRGEDAVRVLGVVGEGEAVKYRGVVGEVVRSLRVGE